LVRAYLLEVGLELADALLVARLLPVHRGVVHLVDHHDQVRHAQRAGQQRVLARLPALLEARLKLALARGDDQHANVGLRSACMHA
jgi:alpha-D-ribose 1-methylphosphonate 5-triphosphate synthase subunit PhnG